MLSRVIYLTWKISREQWLSPETLEKIQQNKLQKMVHHAYENTEFYQNLFDSCDVAPDDIKTKDDLSQLDITTKEDLQNHFDKMVATGYSQENCVVNATSGATGVPIEILYDPYTLDYFRAESFVQMFDTGYKPWEKIAYTKRKPWRSHFMQKLGFLRSYHVDSMLPDKDQAHLLQKIDPALIASYPTLLYTIAKTAAAEGVTINPRSVIIGGELLDPHIKEYIEDTFSTKVYNIYATVEFSTVAKKCSCGNWHIQSTQNLVEFLDQTIVITGLVNKALPLIRYNIEDVGQPKPGVCPCGRGYPMMDMLQGRSGDFITLPDGRKIPPLKFGRVKLVLDSTLAARRYQIIQEEPDLFTIKVVPTPKFTDEIEQNLIHELAKALDYPVNIKVKKVDNIPLADGRKLRIIVSHVSQ
ncbi:MAG: hypothetical protein PVF58_08320 [Candidatus Methanofastidiosia archaeon]|jgi:phenylacetate-CoA ligase